MRTICFAKRNFKEIIRDPLSIIFSVLLPLFLLVIFQQFKIPSEAYKIENFTSGIIIFGFSFISMFTAILVAKDRSTSLLIRLAVSPMRSTDYAMGYTLSVLPIAFIQNILFFSAALILGIKFSLGIIYAVVVSILLSLLFIAIGITIGSVTSDKSAAGASSFIVQIVAFTSGMYFEPEMVGEVFGTICNILPFSSAVKILKCCINNNTDKLINSVIIFLIYTIVTIFIAVLIFRKNILKGNK